MFILSKIKFYLSWNAMCSCERLVGGKTRQEAIVISQARQQQQQQNG
jgi:hypothetical protein